MSKVYFTVTGTSHYFGNKFFEPGMNLQLVKEPDNKYDKEAIAVKAEGLGIVGYVANSPFTVKGESMSAGRIYDRIGESVEGKVLYKLPDAVLGVIEITENAVDTDDEE